MTTAGIYAPIPLNVMGGDPKPLLIYPSPCPACGTEATWKQFASSFRNIAYEIDCTTCDRNPPAVGNDE